MTTWFTSDIHFGHKNILKYCGRPWASVEEMDEALVANWNSVVKDDDTVWNLGDVAFCCAPKRALSLCRRLNGRHIVIRGNHDEWLDKIDDIVPWAEVGSLIQEVTVEGQSIVLCHYALREWHHNLRGTWHLFGHTHAGLRPYGKSVDVGVDNVAEVLGTPQTAELYRPVSFAEVKAFMDAQPIGPHVQFSGFVIDKAKTKEESNATK